MRQQRRRRIGSEAWLMNSAPHAIWISLPHGGAGAVFNAADLKKHLLENGRSYIIQGGRNCALSAHPKPSSLDCWLRERVRYRDTKQAAASVVDALVTTGMFRRGRFICPDSGWLCKGIELAGGGGGGTVCGTDHEKAETPITRDFIGEFLIRKRQKTAGSIRNGWQSGWQRRCELLQGLGSSMAPLVTLSTTEAR